MFDAELLLSLLEEIDDSLQKIERRTKSIHTADDFIASEEGEETFDSICMLFIAIGEYLKRIDRATTGFLFMKYPQVDWVGAIGFRDILAHQYFQVDHEAVFAILQTDLKLMQETVQQIMADLSGQGNNE